MANEHDMYMYILKYLNYLVDKSLNKPAVDYNGSRSLDGLLYPDAERVMIATHNGPMLAKFQEPCPKLLVRHDVKRVFGNGKKTLVGEQPVTLDWFHQECVEMYVVPVDGRGDQASVEGVAGSVYPTLREWSPKMVMAEMDPFEINGLLDGLSTPSDYTYLFIKAVLILRTISVAFSVKDAKLMGPEELPGYTRGDKIAKIGLLGRKKCTIDLDVFNDTKRMVLLLSSLQHPSVSCQYGEQECVYSMPMLYACDIQFVGSEEIVPRHKIPTPEYWWKGMIGAAAKLGAVSDLIKAFRVTRGWGSWCSGLVKLGISQYDVILDCPPTRGCGSVLMDSNLVIKPTNLACSLGELICDWACGAEMMTMLFHLCDEFGLANKDMNRNVTGKLDCSIGSSLLREAGFFYLSRDNRLYQMYMDRFDTRIQLIATLDVKSLINTVSDLVLNSLAPGAKEIRQQVLELKCVAFTAYYGPVWSVNGTLAIGKEGTINSQTWGAMERNVLSQRNWLDMYGLSDSVLLMNGYNAVQKVGIEALSQPITFSKIKGASGKYLEVYREVNWMTKYEVRALSETMEKDRLDFVKTYIDGECEDIDDDRAEVDDEGDILLRSLEKGMSLEAH